MADLGQDFGAGLTAREIDYLISEEWARTADDVLWRRTKCGLPMTPAQRDSVAAYVGKAVGDSVGSPAITLPPGPALP